MYQKQLQACIRQATTADLDAVKRIADDNRADIGFVLRPALAASLRQGWLYVAEQLDAVIGFRLFASCRERP